MTSRQQEIIDKSIEIIAEKGIQGLTIKNLANAINITEPAIYRHFSSKTEILLTMLNNLDEITFEFTEKNLNKNLPPIKTLEKILIAYFQTFAEHPYWVSVIFSDEIFKNEEILSQKIHDILSAKEKTYVRIISKAQKEGEIRSDINKQHLVMMIMGSVRLLIKRWELSGFEFDLLKEGKKLIRSLLKLVAN